MDVERLAAAERRAYRNVRVFTFRTVVCGCRPCTAINRRRRRETDTETRDSIAQPFSSTALKGRKNQPGPTHSPALDEPGQCIGEDTHFPSLVCFAGALFWNFFRIIFGHFSSKTP